MPRLYLLRHAIAELRDPERWPDDALRPLSERGIRRFSELAPRLKALGPAPEVLLTSPYARAAQTAAILLERSGWPSAIEEPAFATGDLKAQTKVLRERAALRAVGVVGHEPDLGRLGSWLLTGDDAALAFEWRRGGVLILDSSGLLAGDSRLIALLPPRALLR